MRDRVEIVREVFGTLYGKLSRSWPNRTICEVLRECYWSTEDETLRLKIVEAMEMGIKMSDKLRAYSGSSAWEHEMFEPNPFWTEKQAARKEQAFEEAKRKLGIE